MGWQAGLSRQAAPAPLAASIPSVPPPWPGLITSPSKWRPQDTGRLGAGLHPSQHVTLHDMHQGEAQGGEFVPCTVGPLHWLHERLAADSNASQALHSEKRQNLIRVYRRQLSALQCQPEAPLRVASESGLCLQASAFGSAMPLDGRLGSIGEQGPLAVSTISEDRPLFSGFASASAMAPSGEAQSSSGAGHPTLLKV